MRLRWRGILRKLDGYEAKGRTPCLAMESANDACNSPPRNLAGTAPDVGVVARRRLRRRPQDRQGQEGREGTDRRRADPQGARSADRPRLPARIDPGGAAAPP